MRQLIVEPEFRDKIPPLSEDEFLKLEENIIADGEVREPLVVWHNTLIDGHHRWKIIQKHPEIPYKVKQMDFADKWAAIVWMCRNQLGRRNVTDEQKTVLIGEAYKAQKMTQGSTQKRDEAGHFLRKGQNGPFGSCENTAQKIATDFKVGERTVKRAEHFLDGLNEAEKVSPGFKHSVVSGEIKAPKNLISEIRNMPEEKQKQVIEAVRNGDVDAARDMARPEPKPEPQEARAAYTADDFYGDIMAAVKNFDFSLKQHLVLVHNEMLRTEKGAISAKRAIEEAKKVVQKYEEMIRMVEEQNEEN